MCVCLKTVGIFSIFQLHYSHTRFSILKCCIWSDSLLWAFVRPPPKLILEDHFFSAVYELLFMAFTATLIWWPSSSSEI